MSLKLNMKLLMLSLCANIALTFTAALLAQYVADIGNPESIVKPWEHCNYMYE